MYFLVRSFGAQREVIVVCFFFVELGFYVGISMVPKAKQQQAPGSTARPEEVNLMVSGGAVQ